MRIINAGKSGIKSWAEQPTWEELKIGKEWLDLIDILNPSSSPRPLQALALKKHRILEHRRNIIVSAPTNSGKSLIGLLVLFEAVRSGRRAVLLEPLRALAREKADELKSIAEQLFGAHGHSFSVQISTGDYRLDGDTFGSPPPDAGEIIIATPERFEAILRNPDYDPWVESIGAVCVDEAHLISSKRRGPTLEYLVTSLMCLPVPPRLVLLSATLGDTESACEWLKPCELIRFSERYPQLQQEVCALEVEEDPSEVVCRLIREALVEPNASVIIFVYQTRSAERLAKTIQEECSDNNVNPFALPYHAQMHRARRESVRQAFTHGSCRCVVATTALGLGVNLPATHVIIRDTAFAGAEGLSLSDLIQMMGRAGRGEQAGRATVIVRPNDSWKADELASALRQPTFPDLLSSFNEMSFSSTRQVIGLDATTMSVASLISSHLVRRPDTGYSSKELQAFFSRSLGGSGISAHLQRGLMWLTDPSRALAFLNEFGRYRPTKLGLAATRSALPVHVAAGFAQLVRDLLTIDSTDNLLINWHPLDSLTVLNLMHDSIPSLRTFSWRLAEGVDAWIEASPQRSPILYRKWIVGEKGTSRAVEVLGSLGIPLTGKGETEEIARRSAYLALFQSILIHERSQGTTIEDLERRWQVSNLNGVEERWRDNLMWLLSGLSNILDLRCFYYHLREECAGDAVRVQRVKKALRRIQLQVFELRENLKYCSPLGSLLRSIRRSTPGTSVGISSIRQLENAGIETAASLVNLKLTDLVRMGVRRDLAKQIYNYMRLRVQ